MAEKKTYKLNQAEYRQKLRNEERLMRLKGIIGAAHTITRQIGVERKKGDKLSNK